MKRRSKRRFLPVVNRSLQYRFLALILIYGFCLAGFLAVFLFIPDIVKLQDNTLSLEARAIAADKILTLHTRVWPAVLLLTLVFGLHSFRVFHRIAGPLYNFTRAFGRIGKGDLSFRVRIRRKDYLHNEEDAINQMMDAVSNKLLTIQKASDNACASLEGLEQYLETKDERAGNDNEYFTSLQQDMKRLSAAIQCFGLQNSKQSTDEN